MGGSISVLAEEADEILTTGDIREGKLSALSTERLGIMKDFNDELHTLF